MRNLVTGKNHRQPLAGWPQVEDLYVFITVARSASFARAAQELGQSPSYISKRIAILEKALNTQLFFRNNRIMRLTSEGENVLTGAMQVVNGMNNFLSNLNGSADALTGSITVSSSFGFGQEHMANALSTFTHQHPGLNVKLMLCDEEVDLVEKGVDIEIHVGNDIKDLYIARLLAPNRRILCAAPAYLQQFGKPETLADLAHHQCLSIRERGTPFGCWLLTDGTRQLKCNVNSHLSSNSGSVVSRWARMGHGITLRSAWDVEKYLERGELVQVLPQWYQEANIWAVYSRRPADPSIVRSFVDFLSHYFKQSPVTTKY
jgi:DNA-binding transcriptional LysR family regulator